jgi:hypothetical protein
LGEATPRKVCFYPFTTKKETIMVTMGLGLIILATLSYTVFLISDNVWVQIIAVLLAGICPEVGILLLIVGLFAPPPPPKRRYK